MITLCFYIDQYASTGPDLSEWKLLSVKHGCRLLGIAWKKHTPNAWTDSLEKVPTIHHAIAANPGATHVFLKEGAAVEFADLPAPTGDVVYFIGRNSRGYRDDLDELEGLTFANLPGGDMWSHDAAHAVMGR